MSDEHLIVPDDDSPSGDDATAPTDDATPESAAPVCPDCGATVEPDQQYCLECGAPTGAAVPLRRRGTTAPVIVAALLALAVGGGALIWAMTKEDSSASVGTGTDTSGIITDMPPFTFTGDTTTSDLPTFTTGTDDPWSTTGTETTDTTLTDDPWGQTDTTGTDTTGTDDDPWGQTGTTEDPDSGSDDWTGGDGYTVILSSTTRRADADRFAERVNATGREAGVLVSDNHSSLRPGYYAVFTGHYATQSEAQSSARSLQGTYPGAYSRRVAS